MFFHSGGGRIQTKPCATQQSPESQCISSSSKREFYVQAESPKRVKKNVQLLQHHAAFIWCHAKIQSLAPPPDLFHYRKEDILRLAWMIMWLFRFLLLFFSQKAPPPTHPTPISLPFTAVSYVILRCGSFKTAVKVKCSVTEDLLLHFIFMPYVFA